jgi:hypothetical protein
MAHSTTRFTAQFTSRHSHGCPNYCKAGDAMTVPRCRACKKRDHPLRFRTLFDCWYCPRCETVRIRVIVNQLITELTA